MSFAWFEPKTLQRLLKIAGLACGLAGVFFLGKVLVQSAENIELEKLWKPEVAVAVIIAAMTGVFVVLLSAWAWQRLLGPARHEWSLCDLTSILAITQLAKYVPGNFAQHLGRGALTLSFGMPTTVLLTSVVTETALLALVGLLVGAACLLAPPNRFALPQEISTSLVVLGIVLVLALSLITIYQGAFTVLCRRFLIPAATAVCEVIAPLRAQAAAAAAYGLSYLTLGVGFWLIAVSIGVDIPIWTATGVFSTAWLLGFLAPGMPAGFGVREGAMLLMLSQVTTPDRAALLTLLSRAASAAGDLFTYGLGWWLLAKSVAKRSRQ